MQQFQIPPQIECTTCLIIEDSVFDQQMMTRAVNRAAGNVQVKVASTLKTARRTLEVGQPALILLDNNLPDGLGANFALELAADTRLAQIPVIIVSDWPSPFMWEKAASAGVLYVVSKSDFGARYVTEVLRRIRDGRAKVH